MATVNGARALGMENQIGTLEEGKKADITIVDLKALHLTPLLLGEFSNVIPNIVFAAQGSDVETVLVNGRVIMENRILKTVNEKEIIERANNAAQDLLERRRPFVPP
jgi:5-methylthioadenosine/S-adenosylhomocysteine deaminase